MVSDNFINECKNRANGNRLGKLFIDGIDIPITNSDDLQSIEINSGCYVDGNIIGSVYAKCLKANFISNENDLTDKLIYAQIGVKYDNLSDEYINMGKYKVERPNNEITANMSQITAYSDLYTNLDNKYICNIDYSKGNITLSDLYIDVCNQLGLIPVTKEFINSTIPIKENPFTNGEKNRLVLQTIAKISCSFIDIDNDLNTIDLCWLSQNEEPDYIFYKNDYSSVEGGQIVCGPINCLIIKNSQIDDENVTIKDDESISLYGEHSIIISEDYILYNAELREQAITNIWNRVKGMKYVDCKLTTYYGKPFLKLGDKIRIYISEEEYFDTYVLKHNFTYDGTFESVIESPTLTEQEIKTKQDISLGESLKNTQIKVNKQEGKILELVEETNNNSKKISEAIRDIDSLQNIFQVTGGNNLIKNSQKLLDDEVWNYSDGGIYLGGYDAELIGKTTSVAKLAISNGKMITKSNNITDLVIGSQHTLSFKISNDENTITTVRLIGNNTVYEETFNEKLDMKEIVFSFITETSNYTLEIESETTLDGYCYIYDLMLNKGDVIPWEPATGEINGTVLKMSQMGLSVYCTGSEIATLMTSQGFQIRRFANSNLYEIVTEFTKDGFISNIGKLKELIVDSFDFKEVIYQGYETLILYKKESE